MKPYIFLCEGSHDQEFFEEFLKLKNIKFHHLFQHQIRDSRNGENWIIRDFQSKFYRRQLSQGCRALIKVEGNVDNCINIFIDILKSEPLDCSIFAIIDQDNGRRLKSIQKKIRREFNQSLVRESDLIHSYSPLRKFFLIPQSLEILVEESTGKKIDNIRIESRRRKIFKQYLQTNPQWVREFKIS